MHVKLKLKTMKCFFTAFVVLFLVSIGSAQNKNDEYRTIFGDKPTTVSGVGCFDLQFLSLGGYYAMGTGGSGGVLLNRQIVFGGGGMETTLEKAYSIDNYTFKNAQLNYGGLWFGYILNSNSPIHPAVFLQSGWGGVNLYNPSRVITDNAFILNPSVEVEVNFTRYFRMAIGAQYQYTMGLNKYSELTNEDFSGPGGKLSFRFGWF